MTLLDNFFIHQPPKNLKIASYTIRRRLKADVILLKWRNLESEWQVFGMG